MEIREHLSVYLESGYLFDDMSGKLKWFEEAAEGYPVDVDLETQGFYQYNDAGTLPGECADFIFHKYND